MKTVFEEEEELAQPDPQPDRELTISSTTLLAIFFGLVLICGLFFGLGYTLGRRAPSADASLSTSSAIPGSNSQSLNSQPKPSAAAQADAAPAASSPSASDADT